MRRHIGALQILAVALGVTGWSCAVAPAQEASNRFREPAPGSYSASTFQLTIGGASQSVDGAQVSDGFFDSAQARPLLGRFFLAAEHRAGAAPVVVLSRDLWERDLHGSPQVIGSTLPVNGRKATVVGIAPHGFNLPNKTQLWVPATKGE
jgi:hypothetical protein